MHGNYADETDVRVRNVTYTGRWPKRLPTPDEIWSSKR
jgi:hypothetical protein